MTKAERADLASVEEKETFRVLCALKVKQRSRGMELIKRPSPRPLTVKGDAEELLAVSVKNMAHEEAKKLRADLRMVLTDGVCVFHVRYLQEKQMELVTPRHQEQDLK